MDSEKREKELANERFTRQELGPLLRLFSSLGVTLALGIVGFFLIGLHADRFLRNMGVSTRGIPLAVAVLAGVGLSVYWCYMRIAKHLARYDSRGGDDPEDVEFPGKSGQPPSDFPRNG